MSGSERVVRRSISRPPPAGTKESSVDVFMQLNKILGTTTEELVPQLDKFECGFDIDRLEILEVGGGPTNYTKEIAQYQTLHNEIEKAQLLLNSLESSLTSFQTDLNALSADMEALQTRSLDQGRKLEIRIQAEGKLAPLVEALILPPSIVSQIAEKDISPQWRASLKYLTRRRDELATLKDQQGFSAIQGAEEQLNLVTRKAVERIRDYMVTRIKNLRSPATNAQAIQVDLLANKDLYKFLYNEHKQLALDLRQAYIYTMRWYYSSNFQRYVKSLEKMALHQIDRSVLLGSDDSSRKGLFYGRSNHSATAAMDLSIGDRPNIIISDDPSVMLAHLAETSSQTHWMEMGFRSFSIALIDNGSVEYHFISDFFDLASGEQVSATFDEIFEPTLQLGHQYTKFLLEGSFDAYGMLICIRLCRRLELELQHRKVPVIQDYFSLQLINLWPRFQVVMDAHCENLRRSSTKSSSYSAVSSSNLMPHHVTQQFASFLYGILMLCEEDDSETEPVANSILRLRNDFESFLTKMSAVLNDSSSKREKFLYNNYSLVSTIISDIQGKLAEQEKTHFRLLTDVYQSHM
jgi:hypothetical protein